jgi:glycosyltransferase involved in cell wall biosynthesis
MKICIDSYPFLTKPKIGPKIFLNRLSDCLSKNFKDVSIYPRFNPFYEIALFSTINKSLFKKPYVVRLDGLFIDKQNTNYDSILENEKIVSSTNYSSGVIFVSKYCKEIYEHLFGKLKKPHTIINNGVPLDTFNPIGKNFRNELKIEDSQFVLISSASWRRHKRLEETIKFFKIISKSIPNLILIILGEQKNLNFQKEKNIIFAGQIEEKDLNYWYRTANMYIHLAWIEPNSNSQAEAIASGLPSICANNGGNFELINKTKAGIVSNCDKRVGLGLIDYYNPPEPDYKVLINDFLKIYNNYENYKKRIVRDNIDILKSAKEYVEFLRYVL